MSTKSLYDGIPSANDILIRHNVLIKKRKFANNVVIQITEHFKQSLQPLKLHLEEEYDALNLDRVSLTALKGDLYKSLIDKGYNHSTNPQGVFIIELNQL